MKRAFPILLCGLLSAALSAAGKEVWLDRLDMSDTACGGFRVNESFGGRPLRVFRKKLSRGIGTRAPFIALFKLKNALSFHARVGIDAETLNKGDGSVRFRVFSERGILADTGILLKRKGPVELNADLKGAEYVALEVTDGGDGNAFDHADWGEAKFLLEADGTVESTSEFKTEQLGILTPPPSPAPAVVGPGIFGVRPRRPVLFRLCVIGEKPGITVSDLPEGLVYDKARRTLRGYSGDAGDYAFSVTASNRHGVARRTLTMRVGEKIALTPPMGWNSWNRFGREISDTEIRTAAKAMIESGIADYGYAYVNLDDCWQRTPDLEQPAYMQGEARDAKGVILPNARFPDMKALTGYIHSLGLKAGLYSSPGPLTCGGCYGSWRHEELDAQTYAQWGFDYLKYDWCSYSQVAENEANPLKRAMKPFAKMGEYLRRQPRDIVYSLCQYGMDHVSAWGSRTQASCWRTTRDVFDNYAGVRAAADLQDGLGDFTAPGAWNDADMLTVGTLGWGKKPAPSRLTRNEQYTQFSLWCIFSSPLLLGCDLENLDRFTLALITNDEVIAVNQDSLGAGAYRKILTEDFEVWTKRLAGGDVAAAIVSRSYLPCKATFSLADAGLPGRWNIRDLWRKAPFATAAASFSETIPGHACFLLRLTPVKECL